MNSTIQTFSVILFNVGTIRTYLKMFHPTNNNSRSKDYHHTQKKKITVKIVNVSIK